MTIPRGMQTILCACLLLICCSGAGFAAVQQVILQLPWHHQFQFAGYYMALEKGFFHEADLEVEIRDIDQGGNPVEDVCSGRADFGVSGTGLLVEYSQGKPVVAVAAIFQEAPTIFISLSSSGIRRPADFAGRKVMLSPGYQSLPLLALLQQERLRDKIQRIPTSFSYTSLLNDETDVFNGYRSNEPYLLESQGYRIEIIDPRDYGIHFYGDILFSSKTFLKNYPRTVENFRAASIRGWEYALDHVEETIALIRAKYQPDKSADSLRYEAEVVGDVIHAGHGGIGHMDLGRWAQITHHLIAIGEVPGSFYLKDEFVYRPPEELDWSAMRPYLVSLGVIVLGLIGFLVLLSRANYRVKRALERLETSEERYRQLVDRVPGLIYTFSLQDGGVCYSPDIQAVLGYTVEDLLQEPRLWYNSIHPDDRVRLDSLFGTLQADETHELEYRIQNSKGEWLWFSDRFVSRRENGGLAVDGVAVDITDKKQLEQKQLQLDQLLKDALDAVSDGVWDWRLASNELILDTNSKDLFGIPGDQEPTVADIFRLVNEEDLPGFVANIEAHLEDAVGAVDHIFGIRREDGSRVWLRGRGRVIDRDTFGQPLRMIGTFVDVTMRKLAEQERLESEARFRMLIEQISRIAIQGYDERRRIIFWNKASEELYGYSETEALGRQLEDLIVPQKMRPQVIREVTRWLEEGVPIPAGELLLMDKNGHEIPVFSSHIMYQTTTGRELYCVDVDMRPIKDAEKKRLELEEQLRQVYKMEAIGTMAGGIAHDFNNSLAIILGNVELSLVKISADSPVKAYLENAKTTILRTKELVQKILIYSRQGVQNRGTLNFSAHLDELVGILRATIPTTIKVLLTVAESARTIRISADPTQLQQILINLCNNAVQAMQEKGTLDISLVRVALQEEDLPAGKSLVPGSYACLSVSDDGCGIQPEVLDRIFDPFFTTKEVGKGTGMGLSVVQGIVESHEGFVVAESQPGRGATFKVYFRELAEETVEEESSWVMEEDLPCGNERLLLVDDEEALLDICKQILEEHGYQVTAVAGGREALDLFLSDPGAIDLVVTDQTMPDMTGKELAAELLTIRPDLPVILASGYSSMVNEQAARASGIMAYFEKPIDLSDLVRTVRHVLDET